jgi:hypothetical protein
MKTCARQKVAPNFMERAELSTDLSSMQKAYKVAVNDWVAAIRAEEDLALVNPTVAQVDEWERAYFKEDEAWNKAKTAKKHYEDAIRQDLYDF